MELKKLVCTTLATGLLLTGCTKTTSDEGKKVDGKYVLASIDNKDITADDFYDSLINTSNATSTIYKTILNQIVDEKCPVNDGMKAELETLKKTYQSYIDQGYESYLLYQIQQSGYNSLDAYYEGYLEYLQVCDFFNQYIEEHYDEVFEDYWENEAPKKVYHILVKMENPDKPTDEEQAKLDEVKACLANGKDFKETAKSYSDDGSKDEGGYLGLSGNSSQYVTEFKDMMNKLEPGTISEPFKTQYGWHIMYIEPTTKEQLKEELNTPDSVLRNWGSDSFYNPYLEYEVFNSYDIKYNDETIEKNIKAFVESQLETRNNG